MEPNRPTSQTNCWTNNKLKAIYKIKDAPTPKETQIINTKDDSSILSPKDNNFETSTQKAVVENKRIDVTHLVVHCKHDKYDVYIGRRNPTITQTKDFSWGNPFKIPEDGNREQVIQKYDDWLMQQPKLIERAKKELKGKVLACWCAPQACHGHVLARVANE